MVSSLAPDGGVSSVLYNSKSKYNACKVTGHAAVLYAWEKL